jgi:hypothetical protein
MTEGRRRPKSVLSVAVFVATASACVVADPDAPSRAALDGLVHQRATRAEAATALGARYTWYAPGTAAWQGLEESLTREDARVYAPVLKAVRSKRYVMYYTTMWQQTWLFLDEGERVESYWTNTQ